MDTRGRGGARGFMRGRGSMRGGPPNHNNGNGGLQRGSGGGRGMSSRGRRGSIRGAPSHMSPQSPIPMSGQGGPGRRVLFGSNRRGGPGAPRGGPVRGRPRGGSREPHDGSVGHPQIFNDYQIGSGYQSEAVYEGGREYQGDGGYSLEGSYHGQEGKGYHDEGDYRGEESYGQGGFHGEESYAKRGYHAGRGYHFERGHHFERGNFVERGHLAKRGTPAKRGYPDERGYHTERGYPAERGYHAGGREDDVNYESVKIGSLKNRMIPQGAAGPAKRERWDPSYSKDDFNRGNMNPAGDYSAERPLSGARYFQEDPFSMDANGEGGLPDYEVNYSANECNRAMPDKREDYGCGYPSGPTSDYAEKRNFNFGILDNPDTPNYQSYDGYSSAPQEMYQPKDFGSMGM